MSVGYDGEASGGIDSTTASGSLGRGERDLGEPVRIQERQVHWTLIETFVTLVMKTRGLDGRRE